MSLEQEIATIAEKICPECLTPIGNSSQFTCVYCENTWHAKSITTERGCARKLYERYGHRWFEYYGAKMICPECTQGDL